MPKRRFPNPPSEFPQPHTIPRRGVPFPVLIGVFSGVILAAGIGFWTGHLYTLKTTKPLPLATAAPVQNFDREDVHVAFLLYLQKSTTTTPDPYTFSAFQESGDYAAFEAFPINNAKGTSGFGYAKKDSRNWTILAFSDQPQTAEFYKQNNIPTALQSFDGSAATDGDSE